MNPWLRRFSKLLCASTLLLIFMGGQVKSHDSGLSVPDWPSSFGQNMFLLHPRHWVGGAFYEHTHRLVAAVVGAMTLILSDWLARVEKRKWVRVVGYFALAAVVAQGVLGGLTVLLLLPASISIAHGVLAQSFLMLTIVLAYSQSKELARRERDERPPRTTDTARWAIFVTALVLVQLTVGAVVRHTESGLAIPDLLTNGGTVVPTFDERMLTWINAWRTEKSIENGADLPDVVISQVVIHFLHRVGGVAVLAAVLGFGIHILRTARDNKRLLRLWFAMDFVVSVQFALGVLTVWTLKTPLITSLHVATGAALLALCTLAMLRSLPVSFRRTSEVSNPSNLIASSV